MCNNRAPAFIYCRDLFALGTHCDPTLLTSACLDHICRGYVHVRDAALRAPRTKQAEFVCIIGGDREQAILLHDGDVPGNI